MITAQDQPANLIEYLDAQDERRLVWLAGYPRSGAALVRTVMVHCFGHQTSTIYDELRGDSPGDAEYREAMNIVYFPMTDVELQAILDRQGMLTVKLHSLPRRPEPQPTIVIVRDGRRTMESLRAFYHERNGLDVSVEDMIAGHHLWGDWSDWIRAWALWGPRDALWLRYEDVMADVAGTVEQIAVRFGLRPIGDSIPPFDALHQGNGTIFRRADVTGNGGLTPEEEDMFWARHGGTMTMMGYRR